MRRLLVLVLLCAACGSPKPPYSFPGCPASTGACASDTFDCARQKILEKHNGCAADADCVTVQVNTICGVGTCNVAVNAEQAGAYRDQLLNEAHAFCDANGNCGGPSEIGEDCFQSGGAACNQGRCVVDPSVDAGPGF